MTSARHREAFRPVLLFTAMYVIIALATLAAIVLLRHHHDLVTDAVWVRGVIVAASSLLTLGFAVRAAGGHTRSLLRLRIIAVLMPVAIVVVVALPGTFPTWMKVDQLACLVVLLPVTVLSFSRRVRGVSRTA